MNLVTELLPLVIVMLATGLLAGVLAGLLGVGGGIVIVPVLDTTLGLLAVDPAIRMHIAVGTSLATIILTSLSSARAHHKRGFVDIDLVRRWGIWVFAGAALGTVAAARLDSTVLAAIFGVVALLVSIKMLLPLDQLALAPAIPRGPLVPLLPLGLGGFSSMMGIGGGTLCVPVLTLFSQPIHLAVGTSALFGLLISVPGTLGFILGGWADNRLPTGSLGYVNLVGLALIAPVTVRVAPLGAKLAHRLDRRRLSFVFGVFLALVGCRMLYRALG